MRKYNVLYGMAIVVLVTIYSTIGYGLYAVFYDTIDPVVFYEARSEKEVYNRGELVTIHFKYEKTRDCDVDIIRMLSNEQGNTIILNNTSGTLDIDKTSYQTSFIFPYYLKNGIWYYSAIANYKCNPINKITVKSPSVAFRITGEGG